MPHAARWPEPVTDEAVSCALHCRLARHAMNTMGLSKTRKLAPHDVVMDERRIRP